MKIEIRKGVWFNEWLWTCPVCHYGMNIPWEVAPSWPTALAEAEQHIGDHVTTGQRLDWIPIL